MTRSGVSSSVSARFLAWVAWGLMLAGYWAPWVEGSTAGLTFSGFDLPHFLVFFQRAGYGPLVRERLWMPLWGLALGLALLSLGPKRRLQASPRGFLWLLTILWPLATWPPYPELLNPWSIEGRGGFIGGLMAACVVASLPLWPVPWRRRVALALPPAVLGITGPELVQAWRLWGEHLRIPPDVGWGLPLYGLGLALWGWAWWRTSW